jgi:hypothetical protein
MFQNLEIRALLPMATLALALSACGGGGGGAPVATTPAATLQAPSITAQPAPQAVNAGQSATVTVNATGTGLTPAGTDTIIAGTPGSLGPVDALAVGSDGTVYVMSENAVLRIVQ